ncbi:MAG TPA: lactate utilization protein [Pyrinomonadaceae bacterium]|jgi:L-lactate dehydrogenase complex protein LldG|nr:lactate utilization protein [Pyrinomonadaceae bacterium]
MHKSNHEFESPVGQHNETRCSMLAAIREQLAASAPLDAVRNEHGAPPAVADRGNRSVALVQTPALSLTECFCASLEAVSGNYVLVGDEVEAAAAVQRIIELKKLQRVAVSDSTLVLQVMRGVEHNAEILEEASAADLFDCDAGITSAQWAIADTGTLMLESAQERHRLASLVPPIHIAIIEASRIRQTMAEVLHAINEGGQDSLSRAVTFITGPSRTSDIELTLAIGVHGPAELHVIVIDSKAGA